MADHLMMPMNHGSAGTGLHGYRMAAAGHQQHAAQPQGMRQMPGGQMMHYGGGGQPNMDTAMRQRQGLVGGAMNGGQMGHHQMAAGAMMYNGGGQQQHHMHQHHQQQPPPQFLNGGLTSQQLMASMQLQKLNTQYHGHPLGPVGQNHVGPSAQYRVNPAQLASMQHVAGPALNALNGVDADMIDEEVLTSLVLELGLDRVQELPELFLGQNEFDFISDFVSKQQPSTVSC